MCVLIRSSLVLAMAMAILATPVSSSCDAIFSNREHMQSFSLRANSPNEPWHGRHLVALPTSHQLGLENFTIHPPTPPLQFYPAKVMHGNYALMAEHGGDSDGSKVPFLAAMKSTTGTRTASMAIVYMSRPDQSSCRFYLDACPAGFECIFDQWTFDEPAVNMSLSNFRFAGFEGNWEPFKDAGKEGWHVYWKGNAGLYHRIQLDLAPTGMV